jgi:hypothetical protein
MELLLFLTKLRKGMMKAQLLRLVTMVCLIVLLSPSDSTSVQENRIALIIGNGEYKTSPLANPVNDANDMAAALKKTWFFRKAKDKR